MKVSVIIPVYNHASFVAKAVHSALDQDQTAEILLVEDGSTDSSLQQCQALSTAFPKVRLLRHRGGQNRGVSASRNLGIAHAQSPFLAFLDADDQYLPGRFVRTEQLFDSGVAIDAVAEAVMHVDERSGSEMYTMITEPCAAGELVYKVAPIGSLGHFSLGGITVKTQVAQSMEAFSESLPLTQDTEWLTRLMLQFTVQHGDLRRAVTLRGVHAHNRSSNVWALRRARLEMCEVLSQRLKCLSAPAELRERVINLWLKYHMEFWHWGETKSGKWAAKWADLSLLLKLQRHFPESATYSRVQYFKQLFWHQPVPRHINWFD